MIVDHDEPPFGVLGIPTDEARWFCDPPCWPGCPRRGRKHFDPSNPLLQISSSSARVPSIHRSTWKVKSAIVPPPLSPVAGGGLPRGRQGRRLGAKTLGWSVELGGASEKARP